MFAPLRWCSIQASSHSALTSSVAADVRTSGTSSQDAISVPLRRRPPRPRGPVRGGRKLALKQHLGTFAEAAARAFDTVARLSEFVGQQQICRHCTRAPTSGFPVALFSAALSACAAAAAWRSSCASQRSHGSRPPISPAPEHRVKKQGRKIRKRTATAEMSQRSKQRRQG